ncbi:hypothetical protein ACF1DY_15185 [Streptomyces albus]
MPHRAPPPSGPGAPAALDARLLGTWSDEPGGAMEASTVFFAPDGTGSSTLLNAAGADDTTRFRRSCPGPGRLLGRRSPSASAAARPSRPPGRS